MLPRSQEKCNHAENCGGLDLKLANIPQKQLANCYLTGSAKVDGSNVTMIEDNGSKNADVPLTVVNTAGLDLPQTDDHGTWMFSVIGILMMSGAMFTLYPVM